MIGKRLTVDLRLLFFNDFLFNYCFSSRDKQSVIGNVALGSVGASLQVPLRGQEESDESIASGVARRPGESCFNRDGCYADDDDTVANL